MTNAAVQPELTIDESQLMRLQGAMREMQRATGADMQLIVRNTSRDMAFELIRRTPIAKRYQSMKVKGRAAYYIMTDHRYSGERVLFTGTRDQAEKYGRWGTRRPVQGRGYAKASFIRVLRELGLPERRGAREFGKQRDPGTWSIFVSRLERVLDPSVTLGSSLPYIGKLDRRANILNGAARAVSTKMHDSARRVLERNTARAMTRAGIGVARVL